MSKLPPATILNKPGRFEHGYLGLREAKSRVLLMGSTLSCQSDLIRLAGPVKRLFNQDLVDLWPTHLHGQAC